MIQRVIVAAAILTQAALAQDAPLAIVPAASYARNSPVAPGSIASAFGANLATANTVVTVADSAGAARTAQIFAASAGQVNFLVPQETAAGPATVTVRGSNGAPASGSVQVSAVAPALFSASNTGRGVAAALALRVAADGARTSIPLALFDPDSRTFLGSPLDLAPASGQVYLSLYGSGIRNFTGAVVATAGGESVPVLGALPQGTFAGLDQVNIGPLPAALAARDEIEIPIAVDGVRSNAVTASILSAPAAGAWGRRADLLEANSEMSIAEANGKLYVIGGYPSSRVSVATVEEFDPIASRWRLTKPMPVALNHTMSVSVSGKIYVIGGQPGAGGSGPFVDTVYEFDPAAETWTVRAPMPTEPGGGAAAVAGGRIYVAGGRPPRGNDFAVYDPAANTWRVLPPLPTQRNHIGAAAIGGKIFVVGGRFEAGFESERTDRLEVFDPAAGSWTTRAGMPRPRGGVNAVAADGCLHVFGGEGNDEAPSGVFPDHDVYNPVTDTWTRLGPMPVPVHGVTGAVFANGLIYLPGGGISLGGSSGSTIHQVYRPTMVCR